MISNKDRSEDSLPCVADFGVTLYFSLCNACFRRLRSTSFKADFIASVSLSANKTASPLLFLAALPIICIKLRDDLANPETSASNIATNETRGKSKPSRSNWAPTTTSSSPSWSFASRFALSGAASSECIQSARNPLPVKYAAKSSQSAFVNAQTREASPFRARFSIMEASLGSWFFFGNTSVGGSNIPLGLTTISTLPSSPPDHSCSSSPGVAETSRHFGTRCQNSSPVNGRLSKAEGKRYPYFTKLSFRLLSPPDMARNCGSMTCDSSATNNQSSLFS